MGFILGLARASSAVVSLALCLPVLAQTSTKLPPTKAPLKSNSCPYYSTPNVEIESKYYRYIDKLVAGGMVRNVIYAQRPWSRREFARLTVEAKKKWDEVQYRSFSRYIKGILSKLDSEFRDEIGALSGTCTQAYANDNVLWQPESVVLAYRFSNARARRMAHEKGISGTNAAGESIGFPSIDANYEPFGEYRGGRTNVLGHDLELESTHSQVFGNYTSVFARPRIAYYQPNDGGPSASPDLQKVYAKFAYRNLELQAGRDELIWGPGEYGGFLFTNNARPLSMIKLSSAAPFEIPLVSSLTGPLKMTYFHGTLGEKGPLKKSIFYGMHLDFMPTTWLELGAGQALILGSTPGNKAENQDYISEFFLKRRGTVGGKGRNVADRNNTANFRAYIPSFLNIQVYGEMLMNVGRGNLRYTFTKLASYSTGLYVPMLGSDGKSDLRLEFFQTSSDAYRHDLFSEGYTYNDRVIGLPIGPQSKRYQIKHTKDMTDKHLMQTTLTHDISDGSTYAYPHVDGYIGDIYIEKLGLSEERWRLSNSHTFTTANLDSFDVSAGYERIYRYNFNARKARDYYLAMLSYQKKF